MTKTKTVLLTAQEARQKVSLHSTFHVGSGIHDSLKKKKNSITLNVNFFISFLKNVTFDGAA
jgi:hypothetical protein